MILKKPTLALYRTNRSQMLRIKSWLTERSQSTRVNRKRSMSRAVLSRFLTKHIAIHCYLITIQYSSSCISIKDLLVKPAAGTKDWQGSKSWKQAAIRVICTTSVKWSQSNRRHLNTTQRERIHLGINTAGFTYRRGNSVFKRLWLSKGPSGSLQVSPTQEEFGVHRSDTKGY